MTYVLCVEFFQKIMCGSEMDFMRNGSGYFWHSKMFFILFVCERERDREREKVCVHVCARFAQSLLVIVGFVLWSLECRRPCMCSDLLIGSLCSDARSLARHFECFGS